MRMNISRATAERSPSCVYFFHYGEDIGHNRRWRHWRPFQFYFDLLPTILRHGGMTVTDEEASQSMTLGKWEPLAGCPCGCSPAIVLNRPNGHHLYVTVALRADDTNAGHTPTVM
jgi:hypothetical protein